jgi:hypothetical protein
MPNGAQWIVLSAVGLTAGVAAALVLGGPLQAIVGMMLVTPLLTALAGAVLGTAQWLPLRARAPIRASSWILATTAGLCIGLAAGVVLLEQGGRLLTGTRIHLLQLDLAGQVLSLAVLGLVSGSLLGLSQSLVLRRSFPQIAHWTLSSGVALSLGFSTAAALVDSLDSRGIASASGAIAFLLISGLLYGAVTAARLQRAA